ncbi:hypothetical protein K435DRAFT_628154, partial [Dendrothele bispora CBS 962.96]
TTELQAIRSCIQNISLPTYVGRPPGNLGEAKHGSLKAYDYFVLFSVIFPLILPEFWWFPDSTDYHKLLLNNFGHLVASTNIISAYSTSTNDADDYMHHYVRYRDSLTDIYTVTWKPNHHYAMHNGDLLRRWGPLAEVSEFFGERANHWGQTVKTNRRMNDLHHTILVSLARQSLLDAHLETTTGSSDTLLAEFCRLLLGQKQNNTHPNMLTELEEALFFKKAKPLSDLEYNKLLDYVFLEGPPWPRSHTDPRHPLGAFILPQSGVRLHRYTNSLGYTFSTNQSHQGNSAIQFYSDKAHTSGKKTGFIHSIWQIPLHRKMRTFFFVQLHQPLPPEESGQAPYSKYP